MNEELIKQVLHTKKGIEALAKAMVEPIRRSLQETDTWKEEDAYSYNWDWE